MDETIKNVVVRVIHIASDFYHVEKSEYTLLNESGYFELYNKVTESDIKKLLKKYPQLIADWLRYSGDSLSSFRWNFIRCDDGKYLVGHWPGGKDFDEISTADEFYACSAYIKRHIESTRILFPLL